MQSGTALIADACPVLGLFPRFIHVQTPNLPQTQLCKSWWLFRRWGWRWPAPMAWHILKTQNQICSKWKHRGFGPCVLGASHVQDSSAFSRDAMADKLMHGILHGMFSWVLSKVVTEQSRAQSFSVLLKTSQHARFKRLSFGTVQNNLKEATRGGGEEGGSTEFLHASQLQRYWRTKISQLERWGFFSNTALETWSRQKKRTIVGQWVSQHTFTHPDF